MPEEGIKSTENGFSELQKSVDAMVNSVAGVAGSMNNASNLIDVSVADSLTGLVSSLNDIKGNKQKPAPSKSNPKTPEADNKNGDIAPVANPVPDLVPLPEPIPGPVPEPVPDAVAQQAEQEAPEGASDIADEIRKLMDAIRQSVDILGASFEELATEIADSVVNAANIIGNATVEAVQITGDSLLAAGDIIENSIKGVMGSVINSLHETIAKLSEALESAAAKIGASGDVMVAKLLDSLSSAVSNLADGVKSVASELESSVGKAVDSLAKCIEGGSANLEKALKNSADILSAAMTASYEILTGSIQAVVNVLGDTMKGASELLSVSVSQSARQLSESVANSSGLLSDVLAQSAGIISDAASNAFSTLSQGMSSVVSSLEEALRNSASMLADSIVGAVSIMESAISSIVKMLAGGISKATGALDGEVSGVLLGLKGNISSIAETITGTLETSVDSLNGTLNSAADSMNGAFNNAATGMVTAAHSVANAVGSTASSAVEKMESVLSGAASTMKGDVKGAVDSLTDSFNSAAQTIGTSMTTAVGSLNESLKSTAQAAADTKKQLEFSDVVDKVGKVSGVISGLSMPGISYQQAVADLSAMSGLAGKELDTIASAARKVAREAGIGAEESLGAFSAIMSEVNFNDIGTDGIISMQRAAVTMSQATGISMEEAASSLSRTIDAFGMQGEEASRVVNMLAAGSRNGNLDIEGLSESLQSVGGVASQAGISMEDTVGALELLKRCNVEGAEAGNVLAEVIGGMQEQLGEDLGGLPFAEALEQIAPQLQDSSTFAMGFGESSGEMARMLAENADYLAAFSEGVADANTAQEMAAIRTDTTSGMMDRCRSFIDDLKIGFGELTGNVGGFATIVSENVGTVTDMIDTFGDMKDILGLVGEGLSWVTNLTNLQTIAAQVAQGVTQVWSGIQMVFNAIMAANPIAIIILAVIALITAIVMCATKVQGWGKQWDSIVTFMKLTGELFVESFKLAFNSLVSGVMNGIDKIMLAWYKFKKAVGIGDENETVARIAEIEGNIQSRKDAIEEGKQNIESLKARQKDALKWELSWKKDEDNPAEAINTGTGQNIVPKVPVNTDNVVPAGLNNGGGDSSGSKGNGSRTGRPGSGSQGAQSPVGTNPPSSPVSQSNETVPNMKGSSVYGGIMDRVGGFKKAAVAASVATMPLTAAATEIGHDTAGMINGAQTELVAEDDQPMSGINLDKFCDTIEIHIANADDKGYQQIEQEITEVLKKMLDDYGC